MVGCNKGGRGGLLLKVKRLIQKCIGTRKRVFSVFSCFWHFHCGILEKQEIFTWTYLTHKTRYAYLFLFTDCWNFQENLDSDLFWAGDGRFWGGFPLFGILAPRIQTFPFFYCAQELQFLRRIFWACKKLDNSGSRKVTRFSWNSPVPLLHSKGWLVSQGAIQWWGRRRRVRVDAVKIAALLQLWMKTSAKTSNRLFIASSKDQICAEGHAVHTTLLWRHRAFTCRTYAGLGARWPSWVQASWDRRRLAQPPRPPVATPYTNTQVRTTRIQH